MKYTFRIDPLETKFDLYCWSDKELTENDRPIGSYEINTYVKQTGGLFSSVPPSSNTITIESDNWTRTRTSKPSPNMSEWRITGDVGLLGGDVRFDNPERVV